MFEPVDVKVEKYCYHCHYFDPKVIQDKTVNDFVAHQTIICSNRNMCRELYQNMKICLKKESKDDE